MAETILKFQDSDDGIIIQIEPEISADTESLTPAQSFALLAGHVAQMAILVPEFLLAMQDLLDEFEPDETENT
jgi:hypothetical protein